MFLMWPLNSVSTLNGKIARYVVNKAASVIANLVIIA